MTRLHPREIVIHVDRLVLEGVPPHDHERVAEAIREELARHLAEGGLPPAWAQGAGILHAEREPSAPDAPADGMGATIARAAYGGTPP